MQPHRRSVTFDAVDKYIFNKTPSEPALPSDTPTLTSNCCCCHYTLPVTAVEVCECGETLPCPDFESVYVTANLEVFTSQHRVVKQRLQL